MVVLRARKSDRALACQQASGHAFAAKNALTTARPGEHSPAGALARRPGIPASARRDRRTRRKKTIKTPAGRRTMGRLVHTEGAAGAGAGLMLLWEPRRFQMATKATIRTSHIQRARRLDVLGVSGSSGAASGRNGFSWLVMWSRTIGDTCLSIPTASAAGVAQNLRIKSGNDATPEFQVRERRRQPGCTCSSSRGSGIP